MADPDYHIQLDRIAAGLWRLADAISARVITAPGGGGAGIQPRGVETGIDASQAFLSGQWVRRSGDIWGTTPAGARKRDGNDPSGPLSAARRG